MSNEVYPKIGTLYALEPGDGRRKWVGAGDQLIPDTAALHCIPLENLVVTEKVDGSNMWLDTGCVREVVGKRKGRANRADKGDQFYFEAAAPVFLKLDQNEKAIEPFTTNGPAFFKGSHGLRLFGELAGPKVNGSGALLDEREFLLFDVQAVGTWSFFRWQAVKDFAAAVGIRTVPELELNPTNTDRNGYAIHLHRPSFEGWREYVTTLESELRPGVPAEGIVVRDGQDTFVERRRIAKLRRRDFK